jgi:polypeptide N-acetylgalactosaminyltransferase
MEYEKQREGLGEHGIKALTDQGKKRREELYKANGYDGYLSDLISVNRSVPDVRPEGCKARKYLANLPTVSVIIPIYNEHFSIVMRTAHSIVRRAQGDLVREVIFVDDQSDPQFLNSSFDAYVAEHFKGIGRVLHLKERVGLIQARMAGARVATSDVLLFSDAHTEATINYLPPLLDPISENYRVCTVPIEDALDVHTLEYPSPEPNYRAIFDWYMNYYQLPVPTNDTKDPTQPYKTPVMKGGLFAISAKFFWELDGYDDQLEIWGGEQYDISFKIWMCGGEMYMVPCSHFGHMFRTDGRPFANPRPYDYMVRNYKRVIEVWMDDYKQYIYNRDPIWEVDTGPLLRQHYVRGKLQCKSFKWYLENVAPEILEMYPVEGQPWFAKGEIRNVGNHTFCVDTASERWFFGLSPCESSFMQNFELSYHHDITQFGFLMAHCADAYVTKNSSSKIFKGFCHQLQGNQFWRYDRVSWLNMSLLRTFC